MSCFFGKAKWKREEVADHKFDFIDVRDYYSNTVFMRLKYMLVYILVIKSFAVYVADIYTAITLLALNHFNGNVYNRVADNLPFDYCKWIFTGCIIFSFCLLAYEAHKSRRVVRSRDISYAYTNVMANNYYCLRSYDHFCFFSQINNSKKKKDEFAFFIFFTFKGWKRLLVADGPRQVINALTLFWIAKASNFSTNLYDYYEGNYFTAIMLLTMIFTVVIFAGSAVLLILASLMYVPLICYIQGNLKDYCCHKIDKRISELVQKKKKQRLGKYAAIARAEAAGDFSHLMNKQGIIIGQKMVQPTLPKLDIDLMADDGKQFKGAQIQRTASISSSTANGMIGGEKGFYGMREGDDYSSTAHLVKNQGYAGSGLGHAVNGTNLSLSSGTLAQSLPGTSHNSPDAYPVRVRGMQGGQEVQRANGPGMANVLAQMGPIGTSPALFAQRQVGRGQHAQSNGYTATAPVAEHGVYGHEYGNPTGDAYELQDAAGQGRYEQQPNAFDEHAHDPYYNHTNGHLDPTQTDLSAYAPYEGEQEYATYDQNGMVKDNSRVQSFAFGDVYDAYLQEPVGHGHEGEADGFGGHTPTQEAYNHEFGGPTSGGYGNYHADPNNLQQQPYGGHGGFDEQELHQFYSEHDQQQQQQQQQQYIETDMSRYGHGQEYVQMQHGNPMQQPMFDNSHAGHGAQSDYQQQSESTYPYHQHASGGNHVGYDAR